MKWKYNIFAICTILLLPQTDGSTVEPNRADTFISLHIIKSISLTANTECLLTYHNISRHVYVSCKNSLAVYDNVDHGMNLVWKFSTGPELDNIRCPPPTLPCAEKRVVTDNYPKVLLILPGKNDGHALLTCGSLHHGMCHIRRLFCDPSCDEVPTSSNIKTLLDYHTSDSTLNFIAGRESTYAFLAPGPRTNKHAVYSAYEYDGRPNEFVSASVSSKYFGTGKKPGEIGFVYSYKSKSSRSGLFFHPDFRSSYKVRYVYGFNYKGFAYFLTTQRVSVDSNMIETRLVRICHEDISFFSYTEVSLLCQRGDVYNLATAAYLGPVGPVLFSRLPVDNATETLYVAFAKTVDGQGNVVDETKGSVLCSFPMSQVVSYFTNTTKECFQGVPRSHLLTHITGEDKKCSNHSAVKIYDDFCGSGYNKYIEGTLPIPGGIRTYFSKHVTSLAVTLQFNSTIAFVGTYDGLIMKINLDITNINTQLLYVIKAGDSAIQKSNTFDESHKNLFMMTNEKVIAVPAGSCSPYVKCSSCIHSKDPLECGWCGTRCAHISECETPGLYTRDTCRPLIEKVEPLVSPFQGGTMVTITGSNFGSPVSGENSIIRVTLAGYPCVIVEWADSKVTCKTSPAPHEDAGPVIVTVTDETWTVGQYDINGTANYTQFFIYAEPKLYGILPPYHGSYAGGTFISLMGTYLNAGSNVEIYVAGVKCQIIVVGKIYAACNTGPYPGTGPTKGYVTMRIDSVNLTALETEKIPDYQSDQRRKLRPQFEYRPDPILFDVHPLVTTVSGTVNITVIGLNLNSSGRPALSVTVPEAAGEEKPFYMQDLCHALSSEKMTCRTPKINITDIVPPSDRAPVRTDMMIGFDANRFTRIGSKRFAPLLYYPDPVYFPFNNSIKEVQIGQTELEIEGENLNLAHTASDIHVLIDKKFHCNVTSLTKTTLYCQLPSAETILEQNKDSSHSLKVVVGTLEFSLGNLVFSEEAEDLNHYFYFLIILVIVLLVLVACKLTQYCQKLKKKAVPHVVAAFQACRNTPVNTDTPNEVDDDVCCGARRRQNTNDYHFSVQLNDLTCENLPPETEVPLPVDDETLQLLKGNKLLVPRHCIVLNELIGEGNYGRVHKALLRLPDKREVQEVAVKTTRRTDQMKIEAFVQEGLLMKDFDHPNVLKLITISFDENGSPMVVIPYMEHGDVRSYIMRSDIEPLVVLDLLKYGKDVAEGMNYLSTQKFVHRDLAARNCMLSKDMVVKVADFGLCRDIYEKEYYCTSSNRVQLPIKWMAIESLNEGTFSSKSDVWSFGVVMWELLTRGVDPYPGLDNYDMLSYLKGNRRMGQPKFCPDDVYNLMLRCWYEDPHLRPNFAQLAEELGEIIKQIKESKDHVYQNVNI